MKVVQETLGRTSSAVTADTYTSVFPQVAMAAAEQPQRPDGTCGIKHPLRGNAAILSCFYLPICGDLLRSHAPIEDRLESGASCEKEPPGWPPSWQWRRFYRSRRLARTPRS